MNALKEELVKKVPVGSTINLFLINNKQIEGTVLSYSDDTFLLLQLTNGEEKPYNYNMIGDWEFSNKPGIAAVLPDAQVKSSYFEHENTGSVNPAPKKTQTSSEIKNIVSMFDDMEIKYRDILAGLQTGRQECNALIGNFEEARKAHELAPRFTGINRMDGILNRIAKLIQRNQDYEEFKKILCLMLLETIKIGEFSYVDKANQILYTYIGESSYKDFVLCVLIGQFISKTKKYETVFRLAEKCNDPQKDNLIKLFVYILNSANMEPSLVNNENIFSAENYNALYSQIVNNFPRGVVEEILIEERPNRVVGKVSGIDTSLRSSESRIPNDRIGFIERPVRGRNGLWVVRALDKNTYTFFETDIEDADVFKVLRDKNEHELESLWGKQPLTFDIEPLPSNGKKVAKRIRLYDILNPTPVMKNNGVSQNDNYNKKLNQKPNKNNISTVGSFQKKVQFYIKKGGIDDLENAEKLLSDNKDFLTQSNYHTLLIQIREKFGKLGYEEKLLPAIEEAINETSSEKTSLYFILRKAYILQNKANGDFRTVVDTLNQWIDASDNIKEYNEGQKNTVLLMAAGYISSIRAQIPDYTAPSPLKESIEKNKEAFQKMNEVYAEKDEEDRITRDQWNNLFNAPVDDSISSFAKSKLNDYNLTGNIRINLTDNGKFIGTVSEAIQEYKKTIENRKVSTLEPVKRYEEYLKAARILYDALTNRDTLNMNEDERKEALKRFSFSLGKSFVSFGDYAVKDMDFPLDTARHYYYEGLKYLIDENDSQDKHNTATRMVLSFFLERSKIPLPSYGQDTSKNLSYNHLPQLLSDVEIKENQINEFSNLVFQYLSEDIFKSDWYWFLNPVIQSKIDILKRVRDLFPEKPSYVGGAINRKELQELLENIKELYIPKRKDFLNTLDNLNNFSFSPNWLSTVDKTNETLDVFRPYMLQCDVRYLERIETWISRAGEYNDNTDSEKKRELLSFIISDVDKMLDDINRVPSKIAFENFSKVLPRFKEQALSAFSTLCETNPPDIIIELSGEKDVRIDNGKIFVQIIVKNKHDSLMADSLSLHIEDNEKFSVSEHDKRSVYIRGGESELFHFDLQIKNSTDKVLKLSIKAVYTRQKSIGESIKEEKSEEITVALTNEKFKKIDNPYREYAGGKKVEDVKMFFGRKDFIDGIVSHLINPDGKLLKQECILLYGQKRTGKSSILMHLKENIVQASKNSIIVDLGEISVHNHKNLDTVFARLVCKTISETLQKDHIELFQTLNEKEIDIPLIDIEASAQVATAMLNDFFHNFVAFLDTKPLKQDYNIVILIDEFTTIYSWIQRKRLNDDFMWFWKGFINNYKLVGILAGKDTMPDFIEAYPNPFGAINKNMVTYLPAAESERMIKNPPANNKLMFEGDAGEKAVKRIRELTADSAWFNMILLNRLVEFMNEKQRRYVSDADINTLCKDSIFSGLNPLKISDFEPLYDDGDEVDKLRLLHNLIILYSIAKSGAYNGSCNQNKITISPDFNESIDDARRDEIITRLINRDVLERGATENLKIKVGLFYDWLTQYCSPKTINDIIKNQMGRE